MLFWSESDPEEDGSAALDAAAALSAEMSDDEYEAKIRGLLRRAYQADCAADAQVRERWRAAAAGAARDWSRKPRPQPFEPLEPLKLLEPLGLSETARRGLMVIVGR